MDNPFIIFPYRDNILELQTKHENNVFIINLKMCKGGIYTQIIKELNINTNLVCKYVILCVL